MIVSSIKTQKITSNISISDVLDKYIIDLTENSIIAIASKVVSICENNIVNTGENKTDLINQESDFCFPPPQNQPDFCLTLKNNRLIPNAGIDESNCKGSYVLLPKNPQETAKQIWEHLRSRDKIQNLGIIITDSNISPLRRGVTGIAISWCGFKPIHDYTDQKDVFGRPLQVAQINLLDSLATVATLAMGEGDEQTPIITIKDAPKISFQDHAPTAEEEKSVYIDSKNDLFAAIDFNKL